MKKNRFYRSKHKDMVASLYTLDWLAKYDSNQKIVVPNTKWRKPHTADVFLKLPGHEILELFQRGMFLVK